ncbi:MAG: phosphatidylserine synthase, partial [Gillisia sp.]
ILNEWFLFGLTAVSCILLNAELPLFALKFSDWSFANNKLRYLFILLCVALIIILKFIAIPLIIICYVLLSLFVKDKEE